MSLLILQTHAQPLSVVDWKPHKHAELSDVTVSANIVSYIRGMLTLLVDGYLGRSWA